MTEPDETWYRYDADRDPLTLILHVQPNAKRTEIAGHSRRASEGARGGTRC